MTRWAGEIEYSILPLVAKLPLKVAYLASRVRARIACTLKEIARKASIDNASQALPKLSDNKIRSLVFRQFETLSKDELETYWFDRGAAFLEDQVEIHDLDLLCQARDSGRGVMLYTGHLGCTGISLMRMSSVLPINLVFRQTDTVPGKSDSWHRYSRYRIGLLEKACKRPVIFTGPQAYLRIRRQLKAGEAILLGIDVPPSIAKALIPVQFFGSRALFPVGPAKLFLDRKPIALFWSVHQDASYKHHIEIRNMTDELEAAGDLEGVAQLLVAELEHRVRKHPEDWLMWESADQFFRNTEDQHKKRGSSTLRPTAS